MRARPSTCAGQNVGEILIHGALANLQNCATGGVGLQWVPFYNSTWFSHKANIHFEITLNNLSDVFELLGLKIKQYPGIIN